MELNQQRDSGPIGLPLFYIVALQMGIAASFGAAAIAYAAAWRVLSRG